MGPLHRLQSFDAPPQQLLDWHKSRHSIFIWSKKEEFYRTQAGGDYIVTKKDTTVLDDIIVIIRVI